MKRDISPEEIKLTSLTKSAGCAAKIPAGILSELLSDLPHITDPLLLVGNETSDDAAVYKINDNLAIVQTVDFFPPMVDDPFTFGQIAACNAISDIYAMGAKPITALNIVSFPNCLGLAILKEILRGGAEKVKEAGASLVGGHSINDQVPKYGLCVSGLIDPKKILKNSTAKPGDVLILTKPIGTGVINTAIKADMASSISFKAAIKNMTTLNAKAALAISKFPVSSCTDVTGFSLLGHSLEMAEGSGVSIILDFKKIPFLPDVTKYIQMGLIPEGSYNNLQFVKNKTDFGTLLEDDVLLTCDPQTSGGLLFSIASNFADSVMDSLYKANISTDFAIVGKVINKTDKSLIFDN